MKYLTSNVRLIRTTFFRLVLFLLMALTLAAPSPARAVSSNYSLFAGTGYLLAIPGIFRFRIYSVELGTYSSALGITKFFPFGSNFHAFFGPGVGFVGSPEGGLIGGMGVEYPAIFNLGIRLELYSFAGASGYMFSTGTVGITINL